jgi:hypothetical protein
MGVDSRGAPPGPWESPGPGPLPSPRTEVPIMDDQRRSQDTRRCISESAGSRPVRIPLLIGDFLAEEKRIRILSPPPRPARWSPCPRRGNTGSLDVAIQAVPPSPPPPARKGHTRYDARLRELKAASVAPPPTEDASLRKQEHLPPGGRHVLPSLRKCGRQHAIITCYSEGPGAARRRRPHTRRAPLPNERRARPALTEMEEAPYAAEFSHRNSSPRCSRSMILGRGCSRRSIRRQRVGVVVFVVVVSAAAFHRSHVVPLQVRTSTRTCKKRHA